MSGMVPHCGWCKSTAGPLTEVGFIESGSGQGWSYYACDGCMQEHRIVPLDEHTADSWGGVRYRPTEPAC